MKIHEIRPDVYYIKFPTQYDACMSMIRMQEFYESPYKNIRGKIFTLEEYMDTWAKEYGHFDYDSTWNGFNVPGWCLNEFYEKFPLRPREREIFLQIAKTVKNLDNYYVIASADEGVINHELAHAYYCLKVDYRKEINALLQKFPTHRRAYLSKRLLKAGYDKSVLLDELQAYIIDSYIAKENLFAKGKITKEQKKLFKPFFEVFKKYDSKKAAS